MSFYYFFLLWVGGCLVQILDRKFYYFFEPFPYVLVDFERRMSRSRNTRLMHSFIQKNWTVSSVSRTCKHGVDNNLVVFVLGLTAIITFQFMRALLPTSTYSHKIIFQKPVK